MNLAHLRSDPYLRHCILSLLCCAGFFLPLASAKDDGRDVLGELQVQVFFGASEQLTETRFRLATEEELELLKHQDVEKFRYYYRLGMDVKPIYRSYENWVEPIEGSQKVMCRFEIEDFISPDKIRLNLELWLQQKKVLKSGINVSKTKPIFVLGPQWRKGRLIIVTNLK